MPMVARWYVFVASRRCTPPGNILLRSTKCSQLKCCARRVLHVQRVWDAAQQVLATQGAVYIQGHCLQGFVRTKALLAAEFFHTICAGVCRVQKLREAARKRREIPEGHTDFGTKSSVLHLVRGVQAPGTHVRSDYPQTRHIGGRSSSHKATLIPQNKRQDTITTMIPCLCSFLFTVPSSPSAEFPINKKRTRTLSRKESGSGTN